MLRLLEPTKHQKLYFLGISNYDTPGNQRLTLNSSDIFPLILQIIIIAQTMSTSSDRAQAAGGHLKRGQE